MIVFGEQSLTQDGKWVVMKRMYLREKDEINLEGQNRAVDCWKEMMSGREGEMEERKRGVCELERRIEREGMKGE